MAQTYAAKYLAKAALSAPRDLMRAAVAKYTPMHPTVLIFHCTLCLRPALPDVQQLDSWRPQTDLSLAKIDHAFRSQPRKPIQKRSLSGGETNHPQRLGQKLPGA